jgi:signal peptide peptidase SppA
MERAMAAANGQPTIRAEVVGSKATIDVRGVLMSGVPWWAHMLGMGMCDTEHVVDAIRGVAEMPGVSQLTIRMDSPGGSVSGIAEAAQAVRDVRAAGKTVHCQVSGMCCSAGYWIASQADTISAGPTDLVGSIGTYAVLADTTGAQADAGVRLVTVSSGGVKGLGADGAVSPALVAEYQKMVDGITALFTADVAAGRKLDAATVHALADGSAHLGNEAMRRGLIDSVSFASAPSAKTIQAKSMPITASALLALLASHPTHSGLITAQAQAGSDEQAIKAAIEAAHAKAKDDQITKLSADLTAANAAHTATKADLAKAQADLNALRGLRNSAADTDPGSDPPSAAAPASDGAINAEWAAMAKDRQANFLGDRTVFAQWVRDGRPA